MKIASVEATPIFLPTRKPYRWAFGVKHGAVLVLLKVTTNDGVEGYGECIGTPSAEAICAYFQKIEPLCIGCSPFAVRTPAAVISSIGSLRRSTSVTL